MPFNFISQIWFELYKLKIKIAVSVLSKGGVATTVCVVSSQWQQWLVSIIPNGHCVIIHYRIKYQKGLWSGS